MRRNRVELSGTVAWVSDRRTTASGAPVLAFRLRVEQDPDDPAVAPCDIHVVSLGGTAEVAEVAVGCEVMVLGSLTERRWKGPGGIQNKRLEILARAVQVL